MGINQVQFVGSATSNRIDDLANATAIANASTSRADSAQVTATAADTAENVSVNVDSEFIFVRFCVSCVSYEMK